MNTEAFAIVALVTSLMTILLEFLWLFILANRQEAHVKKYDDASRKIDAMLETISYHPTQDVLQSECEALRKFVGEDETKMDIATTKLLALLTSDDTDDDQKTSLSYANSILCPLDFYKKVLRNGNPYEKAYACRKIALFRDNEELPAIRKLSTSSTKELSYNAAMALAHFGDEEALAEYILRCENNYDYSHRIILQLMSLYEGDLRSLARRVLEKCNDYIKVTVIKGLASHAYEDFGEYYLEGLTSKNANLKIACVHALGRLAKPEYERPLIIAAHDKNWIVRSAAVTELKNFPTEKSRLALVDRTSDSEWWVRYNAARALVAVDPSYEYVEKVLNGYDKYAADAVKFVLYKSCDLHKEA